MIDFENSEIYRKYFTLFFEKATNAFPKLVYFKLVFINHLFKV